VTACAYLAGSICAGVAVGAVVGALGATFPVPTSARAPLLAVATLACLLVDTGVVPLPTIHRQVNEDWLNQYRGWAYGAGFGIQLGMGVVTIVTSATVYLTLVGELLVGSVAAGALIGATFGVVRAAPLFAAGRPSSYDQLRLNHHRLTALAAKGRRLTLAVTACAACVFIVFAIQGRL
jgi:sulfite exporter TauE/SafE